MRRISFVLFASLVLMAGFETASARICESTTAYKTVATGSSAASDTKGGTCGDNVRWTLSDGVLTISGKGRMKDYDVHSPAPWHDEIVKTVVIRSGVTSIGDNSFNFCQSLTSVRIPKSVTSIGEWAFFCCDLTSINIPAGVVSIGEKAFYGCTSLPVVDGIRYADTYLVGPTDKKLSAYTIKKDTRFIGSEAFDGCCNLASFTIPKSVKYIGHGAFSSCSSLKSITIPAGVTNIERGAFASCSGLTSIAVESGNAVYDSRDNCNAIIETASNTLVTGCMNTTIPRGVTGIGFSAFAGCDSLTFLDIPEGVTFIGSGAFTVCHALKSISLPSSVTLVGEGVFSGCSNLTSITIPDGITSIRSYFFWGCSSLKSITIPSSVTSIADGVFTDCSGLTSITIPSSIKNIDKLGIPEGCEVICK